ncbi:MAG: superoxide dismutase [Bryobacterales bacterium]|nr:superoxide dismutase [Bryobacteraceae bacterium]MDW8353829.1 superoxide dismutase [Bryobacterales bacterium]
MTRRDWIRTLTAVPAALSSVARAQTGPTGPFTLPPLPYPADALEPYIDAMTMQIHHGRHHATYVNNLNAAVAKHPTLANKSIEELMRDLNAVPEDVRTAVRNNGGGHINHSLFWEIMRKNPGGKPVGELAKAIDRKFGSFASFQDQLTKAALGVFGSGWAWLSLTPAKELIIETSPNQDNPWMKGNTPVLGIDVWEHAYYLKYQNRRADYVAAWWNVIHWDFVSERYRKLTA